MGVPALRCRRYLDYQCNVKVIGLAKHPECAAKEQIVALPTLVKEYPLPRKMIVGDLYATGNVLEWLEVQVKKRFRKAMTFS